MNDVTSKAVQFYWNVLIPELRASGQRAIAEQFIFLTRRIRWNSYLQNSTSSVRHLCTRSRLGNDIVFDPLAMQSVSSPKLLAIYSVLIDHARHPFVLIGQALLTTTLTRPPVTSINRWPIKTFNSDISRCDLDNHLKSVSRRRVSCVVVVVVTSCSLQLTPAPVFISFQEF